MTTFQTSKIGPEPAGIVLIDKPLGKSSHWVVNQIRRKTGIKRVGHAGTLDPLASGLLVILVGREYTKRQSEFMKQNKEYEVTAKFGQVSDTFDLEGKLETTATPEQLSKLSSQQILCKLPLFTREIEQMVPAYSAVKVGGVPLYKMARQNADLPKELPSRTVTIFEFELLDFRQGEFPEADFKVKCSTGTYIRSLIHDLGHEVGCGAVVSNLRRTAIGKLQVANAVQIDDFSLNNLIS